MSSSVPTVQSSGKVSVHYYETIGWTALPLSGLSSLSSYKSEKVETINYPYTTGNFAGKYIVSPNGCNDDLRYYSH